MQHPVVSIGGGLAGLTVAHALHQAGISFLLLEARDRLGGRILTADANGHVSVDGFDLGPSWFWPIMQPAIGDMVQHLELSSFAQNSEGDVVSQRMSREAPQRYHGMRQVPQSMRLAGGTGAIIRALAESLPGSSVRLNARVSGIALSVAEMELSLTETSSGAAESLTVKHIILALPPRLLEASVTFAPAIDTATARRWRETVTWMAPHAKFFALYDKPFWRDAGLSGTAQSMVGPLVEIHDATTASGKAVLFGFVGVPAEQRIVPGKDAIVAASVQQLAQRFGPEAANPRAKLFKDWAADPPTATRDDQIAGGHPSPSSQSWVTSDLQDRLTLAGSETSLTEPGYLAGAVEAAERAAREIINRYAGPTDRVIAPHSPNS
ncbi:FAD-dependent oxidoreductase [Agrobacterium sp. Rnr]|uniref:NAD(P)-binding protein n=2 Tax=Hyphomicrobiales TaxID=356 RepID=A0A6L3Y5Y9_9HYPH|nr:MULTISPECIES: FAD-dependent oxidoreductase [Hyphomicrobiales]KAB2678457.1 NAD(P)-binding protein [Brucella tritici]MBO0130479.1 FAD-dependent oxidoreductase [Agrobacterium burrii]